ncbi:MAG: hypothetical protein K2X78_15080 [Burkholderiaceae bacterium]|nr:hypothetical protein [Burkholderiaceae bacterium]
MKASNTQTGDDRNALGKPKVQKTHRDGARLERCRSDSHKMRLHHCTWTRGFQGCATSPCTGIAQAGTLADLALNYVELDRKDHPLHFVD